MRVVRVWCCVLSAAFATSACESDSPTTPSANAAEVQIVANNGDQSFSPNPAQVGGEMVVWRNTHGETHRIVSNDESFDTGNIAPDSSSTMIRIPAGGLNYHCSIHPTMIGAIGGSGGGAPPACTGPYC